MQTGVSFTSDVRGQSVNSKQQHGQPVSTTLTLFSLQWFCFLLLLLGSKLIVFFVFKCLLHCLKLLSRGNEIIGSSLQTQLCDAGCFYCNGPSPNESAMYCRFLMMHDEFYSIQEKLSEFQHEKLRSCYALGGKKITWLSNLERVSAAVSVSALLKSHYVINFK